eukprot:4467099-Prymnesium_polylepis.2
MGWDVRVLGCVRGRRVVYERAWGCACEGIGLRARGERGAESAPVRWSAAVTQGAPSAGGAPAI